MSEEIWKKLVGFAYTGQMTLHYDDVKSVLEAADYLMMQRVTEMCQSFIESHLNIHNILEFYHYSKAFPHLALSEKTKICLYHNFTEVVDRSSQTFVQLEIDDMLQILSRSELELNSEEEAFRAVEVWIEAEQNTRKQFMEILLTKVISLFVTFYTY